MDENAKMEKTKKSLFLRKKPLMAEAKNNSPLTLGW
jgi:hypothetical protein